MEMNMIKGSMALNSHFTLLLIFSARGREINKHTTNNL